MPTKLEPVTARLRFGGSASYGPNLTTMLCPLCNQEFTHIDAVKVVAASGEGALVAASGEDGHSTVKTSDFRAQTPGRRHSIYLIGTCELCGGDFQLVFQQHKGVTLFSVLDCSPLPPTFQSEPERMFWEAASGYFDITSQHPVGRYFLDFAIPKHMIGIEVDGLAFHNGQESFIADRKRQREIEAAGWRVIRFAAKEVMSDARGCVSEVARIIGERAHR